ncbi:MAG: hypothetical protein DME69_11360 [Verrucomicrobia bacterium]|nr:MAG: hypothetical protein DME69_11360 [Verrucomicrobiota bacterium]
MIQVAGLFFLGTESVRARILRPGNVRVSIAGDKVSRSRTLLTRADIDRICAQNVDKIARERNACLANGHG